MPLSNWMYRRINGRIVLIAFLLFGFFILMVLPWISGLTDSLIGSGESPDSSFYYSATDLYDMADSYGEDGRQAYIILRWTFDIVWPLVYVFFLSALLSWFLQSVVPTNKLRLLNLLPVAGAMLDILENTGASIVMARYPERSNGIAEVTPFFTALKWSFLYASFFIVFLAGLWWVYRLLSLARNKKR
ncbi:hypothetical protein [Aureibacillus halotolerans]|uniref:Uncharacterized protein n=1 Tax=Aureibacillus halotolerans TaxID=1508390 RepID=A0A4R6U7X7_9BACI|nr:hypothetical protein [Aureibacillus halotolerans]TDQ42628.1 hypothetical protein EV213_10156 [Aureibacillus halotolerans]